MSKGQKILLSLLALLILGVLMLIHSSPPEVDWSPSYEQSDSRPLGSKVFYDLVKKNPAPFRPVNSPAFEILKDAPANATFVFVNHYFDTDPEESELLFNWVRGGGHLFISATSFPEFFMDSLGLTLSVFPENYELDRQFELSLNSPMTLDQKIKYQKFHLGEYFQWGDSIPVQVLGTISDPEMLDSLEARPNFIQLRKGKGQVTLHAFPAAFSNYFLLKKGDKIYTEQILGTWDLNHPILLDHYIKAGKVMNSSPLYLILNNPYLKAAYFTSWVFLILWVVFEGKRRQKAIKVITPPQNQSLEFAKTISTIYLSRKDLTELGQLQIKLFWDYCRTKFHLQNEESKEAFALSLASKSGLDEVYTANFVKKLTLLETSPRMDAEAILQLHQLIEDFKSKQKHGRNLQPAR